MAALFERLGDDVVVATGHSRGPWSPDALHGGPVAILVAGEVESVPSEAPMMVSRLTLELERPVPLTPLRVSTVVSRPGRKVRVAYHADSTVSRFVEGSWDVPGPVVVWVQLVVDVFEGVSPSPLQRVCAAADFGNGISAVLSYDDYLYINPDLTIHLLRPAVGEWVAMSTKSHLSTHGTGMAESELFDVNGRIGRSVQSLFIDAV